MQKLRFKMIRYYSTISKHIQHTERLGNIKTLGMNIETTTNVKWLIG